MGAQQSVHRKVQFRVQLLQFMPIHQIRLNRKLKINAILLVQRTIPALIRGRFSIMANSVINTNNE